MTPTLRWLCRYFPKPLAYLILWAAYTGLIFLLIGFSSVHSVAFIYWGH